MKQLKMLLSFACIIAFACNNTDERNRPVQISLPIFNPTEEVAMDEQIQANEILAEISAPQTKKSNSLYQEHYGGGFNLFGWICNPAAISIRISNPIIFNVLFVALQIRPNGTRNSYRHHYHNNPIIIPLPKK